MPKVLVTDTYLTDIADAIREKLGVSDTYKPSEMGPAIETITGGGGGGDISLVDNPEYLIAETIDTAQKINASINRHTFVAYFITDTHTHTSSNNLQYVDAQLASMYAVARTIKPDLVIHGGDMTNGSEGKDATLALADHIVAQMRDIGGNDTHILVGNHDGNTVQGSGVAQSEVEARRITEAEMLTMWRSWNDGFTYAGSNYQGGEFYGYRDYADLGLRVIRLHSYIQVIGDASYNGGNGMNWGYYTDEQTWFRDVALNTDNTILIFCHQTLSPLLQGFPDEQDIPHGGTTMQQALDAWLAANPMHRCAGVVHGHVHWDYSAKGKGTFTVINHESKAQFSRTGAYGDFYEHGQCLANYLTSFSTADSTPESSYRDVPVDAIWRGRAANAATQALWTAVIVDTNAESINLIRCGAGPDRVYSYGSGTYYAVTSTLTHVTISNAQTVVADGESYTATITAQSGGYTINSVTVTMGGVDITSTAYNNGTITIAAVTGDVTITAMASKPRINLLPSATDTDGTIYNGTGYKADTRLNSAGNPTVATGYYATGFIPVTAGQKVTFENMVIDADNSISGYNMQYLSFYDSSKTLLPNCSLYARDWIANSGINTLMQPYVLDNTNLISITPHGIDRQRDLTNVAYMRVSARTIDGTSAIYAED